MTDIFLGQAPEQDGDLGMNEAKETLNFLVQLDSFDSGQDVACQVAGIPAGFSLHPTIPLARLRQKSATRQGNSCIWKVKCEYSTPENNTGEDQENDDPTLDVAEVKISYEDREEVIQGKKGTTRTYTGAIKTSAGEIYSPPPTDTVPTMVVEISQNYAYTYDVMTTAYGYLDTINDATFYGWPKHTVKVCSVVPKTDIRDGNKFLNLTFVLKFKASTWDKELLDIGSYYLNGSGEPTPFKDKEGHPKQGLLDGSGHPLGGDITGGGSGLPDKYLDPIQTKTEKDFSALNLLLHFLTSGYPKQRFW